MRLPDPPPVDAVGRVTGARVVPGDQWIELRAQEVSWVGLGGLRPTWEHLWWREALDTLHGALAVRALTCGPVIARSIRFDERGRTVDLIAETWGRGVAGAEWGLPWAVRSTLDGLAPCPNGGDLLHVPQE